MKETFLGHSVVRKEGCEKVTGRARYVDDLAFPDASPEMIHGATVPSSVARGRILGYAMARKFSTREKRRTRAFTSIPMAG